MIENGTSSHLQLHTKVVRDCEAYCSNRPYGAAQDRPYCVTLVKHTVFDCVTLCSGTWKNKADHELESADL